MEVKEGAHGRFHGGGRKQGRQELNYRILKFLCSFEGGYVFEGHYFWYFKGVFNLAAPRAGFKTFL